MTQDKDNVAAEIAVEMRQAARKVLLERLGSELGDEGALKVLAVIEDGARKGQSEEDIRDRLKITLGEHVGGELCCAPAIGIGVNGLIYLKVTADVMED